MNRFRFLIMDFGDKIEDAILLRLEQKRKKIEREARRKEALRYRAFVDEKEKVGKCEFCQRPICLWRRDCYVCYRCFYEDLALEGEVMVPPYHAEDMRGYMGEDEWNEIWEGEQLKRFEARDEDGRLGD